VKQNPKGFTGQAGFTGLTGFFRQRREALQPKPHYPDDLVDPVQFWPYFNRRFLTFLLLINLAAL